MVVILTFMLLLLCQNKTAVDGDGGSGARCQNAKPEVEVHHSMCIENCISSAYNVSGPS